MHEKKKYVSVYPMNYLKNVQRFGVSSVFYKSFFYFLQKMLQINKGDIVPL